jgi:UDP-glucose 4-epimerase
LKIKKINSNHNELGEIWLSTIVTGGAGFIGSNLVEDLLAHGEEVVVIDNMQTGSMANLQNFKGNLKVIQASCAEIGKFDLEPESIYHLGIPSSSPMYRRDPFLVGSAINDFIAVFELAKKIGARVVYASSSSLYNGMKPPHKEDMQIPVTDYYTEARLAMERIAELYKQLFDVSSVGLRFFSVYGPKEEGKKQYANMISQFLWIRRDGKSPVIYGDGSQTRDFVYVKDATRALMLAMNSNYQGLLNVGTGKAHSFNDVIALINLKMKSEIKPIYVDNPIKNYVKDTLADTTKSQKIIGFKASCSLDEGINELLKRL